jgi:predicted NUDIX family phosphoesterase
MSVSDEDVERVLVVPREVVPDNASWYGLRADGIDDFLGVVEAHGRYEPRAAMEVDPSFKQIIPYLVLRDRERYFLMRRTRAGGDARLHDRWSIGVGGHVEAVDDGLAGGLRREWHEELVARFEPTFTPYALLNDDTTDVGAVHLGVVVLADADGRPVSVRETTKLSGAFATPAEVAAGVDHLESWSRIVFEALEVAAARRGR